MAAVAVAAVAVAAVAVVVVVVAVIISDHSSACLASKYSQPQYRVVQNVTRVDGHVSKSEVGRGGVC